MSLTLDYPYNRNIVKKLSDYMHMWEPMLTSNIRGGNHPGSSSARGHYVLPGSSAAYPMFNMVEQDLIDSGKLTKKQILKGNARKSVKQSEVASDIAQAIESSMGGSELSGGAIDFKKIKRVAIPILKLAASRGLDVGLPALGASVSTFLGGNPLVGAFVGKLGRDILKQQTGLGRKLNRTTDVAEYKGGSHYKKKAPQKKAPQKGTGHKAKPKVSGGRNKRNEIVKKIMKEKNLSLPQASKYVKEHGLY